MSVDITHLELANHYSIRERIAAGSLALFGRHRFQIRFRSVCQAVLPRTTQNIQ